MEEIQKQLKIWREARNMQDKELDIELEVANMLDECKEALRAETNEHRAEEICDVAIFAFNSLGYMNEDYVEHYSRGKTLSVILECIADVLACKRNDRDLAFELSWTISICENAVEHLGYDFEKMMLEKIKVISSRVQCPEQAKDWAENGASGKWEKSKLPEHKAMVYKPDFESCRLYRGA